MVQDSVSGGTGCKKSRIGERRVYKAHRVHLRALNRQKSEDVTRPTDGLSGVYPGAKSLGLNPKRAEEVIGSG